MARKWTLTGIAGTIGLSLTLGAHQPADAAVTVTATETGGNVVVTSTGSLNIDGLSPFTTDSANGLVNPINGAVVLGATPADAVPTDFFAPASAPTSFGTGGLTIADSGSGPRWGFANDAIALPDGYTSGDALNASLTYNSNTFALLGMTPGTYVYTLPTADSVRLKVVPVPAALPLLGSALFGLGFIARRRARRAAA